jgi:hypothetical protein
MALNSQDPMYYLSKAEDMFTNACAGTSGARLTDERLARYELAERLGRGYVRLAETLLDVKRYEEWRNDS